MKYLVSDVFKLCNAVVKCQVTVTRLLPNYMAQSIVYKFLLISLQLKCNNIKVNKFLFNVLCYNGDAIRMHFWRFIGLLSTVYLQQ